MYDLKITIYGYISMSVCSEVGISVQVHLRTIVNIVYSVYRHVRVCKVVDVCEVSIQCPYTDVIVFAMYRTRAVNTVYSSSHDYTVPIYGYDIFCRIHVLYMTRAVTLILCTLSREYTITINGNQNMCMRV